MAHTQPTRRTDPPATSARSNPSVMGPTCELRRVVTLGGGVLEGCCMAVACLVARTAGVGASYP